MTGPTFRDLNMAAGVSDILAELDEAADDLDPGGEPAPTPATGVTGRRSRATRRDATHPTSGGTDHGPEHD